MKNVKEDIFWSAAEVQNMCIKHEHYTKGDCVDYDRMLTFVSKTKPTLGNVYKVARDIAMHSEFEALTLVEYIETVMFILSNECVRHHFSISKSESEILGEDEL